MKHIIPFDLFVSRITEAFREQDMPEATKLIIDYLTKQLGKIYEIPDIDEIKKDGDPDIYLGKRYLLDDLTSFRINWYKQDSAQTINSVDVFGPTDKSPAFTMSIGDETESIVQILPAVADFIQNPTENFNIDDYFEIEERFRNSEILEYRTKGSKNLNVRSDKGGTHARILRDLPNSLSNVTNTTQTTSEAPKRRGRPPGSKNKKTVVTKAPKETIVQAPIPAEIVKIDKKYEDVFDEMGTYVDMVIDDLHPSLLIVGMPGVGKTYRVTDQLQKAGLIEDEDFVTITGQATGAGMYTKFYENNGKILVFDDCDKAFTDSSAVMLLKGALDSKASRKISWMNAGVIKTETGEVVPKSFIFTGSVIFISNKSEQYVADVLDPAIKSRVLFCNVQMDRKEVIRLLTDYLSVMGNKESWGVLATPNIRNEALSELLKISETHPNVELGFRTLEKIMKIRITNHPKWKMFAISQVL